MQMSKKYIYGEHKYFMIFREIQNVGLLIKTSNTVRYCL